jgi:hypothetical protein
MHVASHDLFNMKLRTCLDTGNVLTDNLAHLLCSHKRRQPHQGVEAARSIYSLP